MKEKNISTYAHIMQLASDGYEPLLSSTSNTKTLSHPRPGGVNNDLSIVDGLALAGSHGVLLQRSVNGSSKCAGLEPRC